MTEHNRNMFLDMLARFWGYAIVLAIIAAALLIMMFSCSEADDLDQLQRCKFMTYVQPIMPKIDQSGFYTYGGKPFHLRGNFTRCAPDCRTEEGHRQTHCWTIFDCNQTRQGAPIGYCQHQGDPDYKGYQIGDVVVEERIHIGGQ
jgi:hypothetical protein